MGGQAPLPGKMHLTMTSISDPDANYAASLGTLWESCARTI
jgi:hypothetical protein